MLVQTAVQFSGSTITQAVGKVGWMSSVFGGIPLCLSRSARSLQLRHALLCGGQATLSATQLCLHLGGPGALCLGALGGLPGPLNGLTIEGSRPPADLPELVAQRQVGPQGRWSKTTSEAMQDRWGPLRAAQLHAGAPTFEGVP
jgi:hypothetical protein